MSKTIGMRNGDWDFDGYGRMSQVQDSDKTSQDLAEMIISDYDPTRDYGTHLTPGYVPPTASESVIAMELSQGVGRLQRLQQQDKASTPSERISSITQLDVARVADDPTAYEYELGVKTEDGDGIVSSDRVRVRPLELGHLTRSSV
jgi:hypothetical protein